MTALYMNRVPTPWSKLAWPSERALDGWLRDLSGRIQQLAEWTTNPLEIPAVTWISGLQNPQSFLTAIMQQTKADQEAADPEAIVELDKLMIVTEVQKEMASEAKGNHARDGAYISGLYLEGASWNKDAGVLDRSRPRQMNCEMPLINVRAVPTDHVLSGIYQCPVYKTLQRGPTYVFSAQLKTTFPPA